MVVLYASISVLNLMRAATGSQCKEMKRGVTCYPELTENVTSYISFCEDMCILTRTRLTYNNGKLWFATANSDSSIRPKKMLTGRGTKYCINRPNTHWKGRSEWQRGIMKKNKDSNLFQ